MLLSKLLALGHSYDVYLQVDRASKVPTPLLPATWAMVDTVVLDRGWDHLPLGKYQAETVGPAGAAVVVGVVVDKTIRRFCTTSLRTPHLLPALMG